MFRISTWMKSYKHPVINGPNSKPVLPTAVQTETKNSKGLKICTCIVLSQKVFSQPSQYCNFLFQVQATYGFYAQEKMPFGHPLKYSSLQVSLYDTSNNGKYFFRHFLRISSSHTHRGVLRCTPYRKCSLGCRINIFKIFDWNILFTFYWTFGHLKGQPRSLSGQVKFQVCFNWARNNIYVVSRNYQFSFMLKQL